VSSVRFDASDLRDPQVALQREWLVTNGRGGYASGSVANGRTRRYHGLLVAATDPPTGRSLTVAGFEESAYLVDGDEIFLDTVERQGGLIERDGCAAMDGFTLEDGVPTWRFVVGASRLIKRVWMDYGRETAWIAYTLDGKEALRVRLTPLCAWRDHHAGQQAGAAPDVQEQADGLRVTFPGGSSYHLRSSGGGWKASVSRRPERYLRVEEERGFPALEDLWAAGDLDATIAPGETLAIVVSLEAGLFAAEWQESLAAAQERAKAIVQYANLDEEPDWLGDLVLAADQFVVARGDGDTVIAGYPWFTDWGRDTFIALPGLSLACGRPELAAGLLRTFARHLSQGLIPNRFPDAGDEPEYNTVDATLWMVEALRQYAAATLDETLVDDLWPQVEDIAAWHLRGTRYGIRVDPDDGLLTQGGGKTQLTWMDVRIEDRAITPRNGKPVEINALWYSALRAMATWSETRGSRCDYASLAEQTGASFQRFWNPDLDYLYDVIDGPTGDDASVRPNAVIAASLELSPLTGEQRRAIVRLAERDLLTPRGLRSLSPYAPAFAPRYEGGPIGRDEVYHQGTVWAWLIGPYVSAHLRAFTNHGEARKALLPFAEHVLEAGVGSISEIFDATSPFTARGCPWQAWSVAEVLRAWRMLSEPWR
jgi:predicted glycogen debranching enzyme